MSGYHKGPGHLTPQRTDGVCSRAAGKWHLAAKDRGRCQGTLCVEKLQTPISLAPSLPPERGSPSTEKRRQGAGAAVAGRGVSGLSWPYPALLTGELCPAAWPASSASALLPAPGGFTEMSLDGGQRLVDETSSGKKATATALQGSQALVPAGAPSAGAQPPCWRPEKRKGLPLQAKNDVNPA